MMSLGLWFWLAKRSRAPFAHANAVLDLRHRLKQQTRFNPKGKGNRAWKRAKVEAAKMRKLGWFTYAELLGV